MVRVAIALLLFVLLPSVAQAEKRIAFVVGIDKYDNLGPQQQLQRAVNDARSVGAALAPLGFEVVSAENIGRATFNAQWQKFLDKINPGDTSAVYFSGHGVEIEGLNFLLPRDVPNISYGRQEQLKRESLSVSELLLDLRKRKPQVTLLMLDACRDNPLISPEQRALNWGRGLARMDAPSGTFIMYSAGAGETALDRLPKDDPDKVNSVYTRKLLPLLKTPGLPLHDLARQLRREVHELAVAVPHVQQPAYYDGLIGKFCLAGCEVTHASPPAGTFALKEGTVVPNDLPPAVQRCLAAQGEKKPWEYDWAKCGVVKDIASATSQPMPKATVPPKRCDGVEAAVGNERRCLKPKDTFKDCPECPAMVVVPAGSFMMGSPPEEVDRSIDEGPQRKVAILKPFAVGKFEVAFAEWDACMFAPVAAGGCKHRPDDLIWDHRRSSRPVINVSWDDITNEFLPWLSRKTGKTYRLLTEAEWEYAGRAGTTTAFSTGRTITLEQANIDGKTRELVLGPGVVQARQKTVAVGSFQPNAFGLHDMHGNVWEWVEDCYEAHYIAAPTDNSARTGGDCRNRVSRGGAWIGHPGNVRSANRQETPVSTRSWAIGFRVARTLSP